MPTSGPDLGPHRGAYRDKPVWARTRWQCPANVSRVLPNLSQHKVNMPQSVGTHCSGMRRLRVASFKGRFDQGTHRPRDTLSKGSKILDWTHCSRIHRPVTMWTVADSLKAPPSKLIYRRSYIFSAANFWEKWIEITEVFLFITIFQIFCIKFATFHECYIPWCPFSFLTITLHVRVPSL